MKRVRVPDVWSAEEARHGLMAPLVKRAIEDHVGLPKKNEVPREVG